LEIKKGEVLAKVAGSELYNLRITIKTLPKKKWNGVKQRCSGQIGSLLELLQGKLSSHVMEVVTDRNSGLFPLPGEISLNCDCPDWAVMCKHVAAVLYGVGARLDQQPELLFKLRGVDHEELIAADAEAAVSAATSRGKSKRLAGDDLSDVFGIDLDPAEAVAATATPRKRRTAKKAANASGKKAAAKKGATRKVAKKEVSTKRSAEKGSTSKKAVTKKPTRKKTGVKKGDARKTAKKAVRKKSAKTTTGPARKKKFAKKAPRKKAAAQKTARKPR
jgi:uncharacterized Zn finger protein